MLAEAELQAGEKEVGCGDEDVLHRTLVLKNRSGIKVNEYADKRVVIKGCGDKAI